MKIASFVREGIVDCGLVDGQEKVHLWNGHPRLGSIAPEARLKYLLALSPAERRELAAGFDWQKQAVFNCSSLAPAVPFSPLYIYAHNNNPTTWKRQFGVKFRWNIPRVTVFRVRPWSSFSGHGATVDLPQEGKLAHGCEVGFVIGKEAWQVPESQAADHVAGMVVLNDMSIAGLLGLYDRLRDQGVSSHVNMAVDTLAKSADGNGVMGPWIITVEEMEEHFREQWPAERLTEMRNRTHAFAPYYNLLMWSRTGNRTMDRAHTSALGQGVEYLIAYFSRFMTLPVGTVIGLGAAGWDGQACTLAATEGATQDLEVEIEHLGTCRTHIRRTGTHAQRPQSPFLQRLQAENLPVAKQLGARPGRSLWICRGNYRRATVVEGIPEEARFNPLLYPSRVLGEDPARLVFQPHMGRINIEVHLAAVIGQPAYNLEQTEARSCLAGIAILLSCRDLSLGDWLEQPFDFEARGAWFLGGCADGFARLGTVTPVERHEDLTNRRLTLQVGEEPPRVFSTADYRAPLEELVSLCARQITLLPGDLLSLGPTDAPWILPAQPTFQGKIRATGEGLGEVMVTVEDRRDPKDQQDNSHWLNAGVYRTPGWK